jgi:hypothetical protein
LMTATMPFVASLSSARPSPTAAAIIEGLSQVERNSIMAASGDGVRDNVQPQEAQALDPANDQIEQLALARVSALEGRLERLAPAHMSPENEARSPETLVGTLTPEQLDSLSPRELDPWEQIRSTSQGRERDEGSHSRQIWAQRAIAERSDSRDRQTASIFGRATESFGQLDTRFDPGYSHSTVDRGSGSSSAEGLESGMSMRSPADEAVAAAAHEVERLRSAVRQTIDELERVRGSVHPPLPSLPINRGSFRIS